MNSAGIAAVVQALDPAGPLEARWIRRPARFGRRLGLLPGSFNPPTQAHLALAEAGRAAGLESVVYLLSKRTVNKEDVTGIPLADRLELLADLSARTSDGVAFANRGLYVDLAAAMRPIVPPDTHLVFLVGHDKIVQIFDPRYYEDRDAALDALFDSASFLVAPRGADEGDDLATLLADPKNARYATGVAPLELSPDLRDVSATRVRQGKSLDVPETVRDYLRTRRPFG